MKKTLIIGPFPPKIGGIASIVDQLKVVFEDNTDVLFINSAMDKIGVFTLIYKAKLWYAVFMSGIKFNGGTVLFFSSAYWSFWEKCIWAKYFSICGFKVVMVMVDGNFPDFYSRLHKYLKGIAEKAVKKISIVAVQSAYWKEFYRGIFPESNIEIVNAYVDTQFFKPKPISNGDSENCRVLFVGWLIKAKGIYDLIEAAVIVRKATKRSFVVRLVGPFYEDRNYLVDFISRLGANDLIELIGPITSRDTLRIEYQEADIFVLPSYFEGFPVALLEAISSGLPSIGTRVGGIPDILDGGECGLLVEKERPDLIANALLLLLNNPELRRVYSIKARERALLEYSLSNSMMSYKRLINL